METLLGGLQLSTCTALLCSISINTSQNLSTKCSYPHLRNMETEAQSHDVTNLRSPS